MNFLNRKSNAYVVAPGQVVASSSKVCWMQFEKMVNCHINSTVPGSYDNAQKLNNIKTIISMEQKYFAGI